MSRSRRKVPIMSVTTAESDAPYKHALHHKNRAIARAKMRLAVADPDGNAATDLKHTQGRFSSWISNKDGKTYWDKPETYRK